jgi:hypothetical protein
LWGRKGNKIMARRIVHPKDMSATVVITNEKMIKILQEESDVLQERADAVYAAINSIKKLDMAQYRRISAAINKAAYALGGVNWDTLEES